MAELSKVWEWVICRKCGTRTIRAKFCMKCGAELVPQVKALHHYHFYTEVIGEDKVGKSTFLEKISSMYEFVSRPVQSKDVIVTWNFMEAEIAVAFREKSASELKQLSESDAFILLFDLTNRLSFVKSFRILKMLRTIKGAYVAYFVGNKSDLVNQRAVQREEAVKTAIEFGLPYFEVSASTGDGVDALLQRLIKDLLFNRLQIIKRVLKHGE